MNIVKHKSVFPSVFDDDIDSLFQGFFRPVMHSDVFKKDNHMPAVDIDETENSYLLMAELPGFNKDDIEVSFNDGQLIIKAEHNEEAKNKDDGGNIIKERRFGRFFRSFNFDHNIAEQDIGAKYENGVLEMTIPKMTKTEKEIKKIEIN